MFDLALLLLPTLGLGLTIVTFVCWSVLVIQQDLCSHLLKRNCEAKYKLFRFQWKAICKLLAKIDFPNYWSYEVERLCCCRRWCCTRGPTWSPAPSASGCERSGSRSPTARSCWRPGGEWSWFRVGLGKPSIKKKTFSYWQLSISGGGGVWSELRQ